MRMRLLTAGLLALAFSAAVAQAEDSAPPPKADDKPAPRLLVLGAGEVGGYNYPVGGAVCRVVNKDRLRHGLRCVVEPSAGSSANLAALKAGEIDLAIVQSKVQEQAARGLGPFQGGGPFAELRSLMSLHDEALVVLVRKDARVTKLTGLKGRKVNLGKPGTFQRAMADGLMEALGWAPVDLAAAMEIEPAQQARALCEGKVDAAVLTAVHPAAEVRQALECGATLADLSELDLDSLVQRSPWLARVELSGSLYGVKGEIATFGTKATLVATTRLPDEVAYEIVKAVWENFLPFSAMYPPLGRLSPEDMGKAGLTAPLHDGAARYHRRHGEAARPG
ncbi:MAG: TAXI family TRAP transporter solute-binding subunit [Rhodospirillales bacterium]|nr:TAXI family TRAP transporter solute-binding subunit [Rhodospirillales bacterium]